MPSLPTDLADVDDALLMELFSRYVSWQNYIAVRVTEAEIAEAEAQTQLTVDQAQALLGSWSGTKEDRVALARAEREVHPKVQEQQARFNTAKAHRKMLATLAENMERAAMVVSRELTRRVGGERRVRDSRQASWTP